MKKEKQMPLCIKLFKLRTMKGMQSKGIHFPNTNEPNEACEKLRPTLYANYYNLHYLLDLMIKEY